MRAMPAGTLIVAFLLSLPKRGSPAYIRAKRRSLLTLRARCRWYLDLESGFIDCRAVFDKRVALFLIFLMAER